MIGPRLLPLEPEQLISLWHLIMCYYVAIPPPQIITYFLSDVEWVIFFFVSPNAPNAVSSRQLRQRWVWVESESEPTHTGPFSRIAGKNNRRQDVHSARRYKRHPSNRRLFKSRGTMVVCYRPLFCQVKCRQPRLHSFTACAWQNTVYFWNGEGFMFLSLIFLVVCLSGDGCRFPLRFPLQTHLLLMAYIVWLRPQIPQL